MDQVLEDFEAGIDIAEKAWFVYEALEATSDMKIFPPFKNGGQIQEVIEALVDDPGESRQWLVFALPIYGCSQVRYPEFECVRPLDKNEIFTSRRGVFWNGDREGIMLGEIGADLFHEYHGDIIEDVDDRMRDFVIETIADQIVVGSGCNDFPQILDAIDEEFRYIELLELWYHELAPIADSIIQKLLQAK